MKKLLLTSLLSGFLFMSSVVADDKCIHVAKTAMEAIQYLEVNMGEHPFEAESDHFRFALNFDNKNTIVFSKRSRYMFIGVGDNTAYYAYKPREDSAIEIYRVNCEDETSPITLFVY